MSRECFSQLTAADVNVLMSLLEHYSDTPTAYTVLLRDKLNHASIFFGEDVPADVVTIDSRLEFSVDGVPMGPHVLVKSSPEDLPNFALSIHSMRGLALLGLAVGESVEIITDEGGRQTLRIDRILFQPEEQRRSEHVTANERHETIDRAPQVISFRPRQRSTGYRLDDDPGPSAA